MSGDHNMHCSANQPTKCTRCGENNPAEIHTCTPQSKAQRLADELDKHAPHRTEREAAAELRRLDALVGELVEALEFVVRGVPDTWGGVKKAREVIAKAKEQT